MSSTRARRSPRRGAAGDDRRAVRDAFDRRAAAADVVERDHGSESAWRAQPRPRGARPRAACPRTRRRPRRPRRPPRPEMIRRSGDRSSRAATSSSSGRTRLASTVGAHGPAPAHVAARDLERRPRSRARRRASPSTDAGLDVAGEHRRPAELRGGNGQHAAAAAPVGQRARRLELREQLQRQARGGVRAGPERLPRLDDHVQRARRAAAPTAAARAARPHVDRRVERAPGSTSRPAARWWRRRPARRRPPRARRRSAGSSPAAP